MQRKIRPTKLRSYVAIVKIAVREELPIEDMMEMARICFKPKTKLSEDRLWNKLSYICGILKTNDDLDKEIEDANALPTTVLWKIIEGTYMPPEPKEKSARKNPRRKKCR